MTYRRFNNLLIIFIIFCSTSFYNLKALGSAQKVVELLGVGIIAALLLLHIVYGEKSTTRYQYTPFIGLIFLSVVTSAFMAAYTRNQPIAMSLFAQRAIFFYLLYFLLHQMKVRPGDLEKIIIGFGILHGLLFLLQYTVYPKILFDTFILVGRGTIRIYLAGSDYLAICFFMSGLAFLRTNRPRFLLFMLLSYSVFILLGGRQTMALMAFVLLLAIIFSRKVKSRIGIAVLSIAGVFLIFLLFQPIIQGMMAESQSDKMQGTDYIRFQAAGYFLTDFYKSNLAYITGNGVAYAESEYGRMIETLKISRRFFLGDIGIFGSYVLYGIFFIIAVFGIIIRTLKAKLSDKYVYIRYVFIGFLLSLPTGGGFEKGDFIVAVCCLLYIVDVIQSEKTDEQAV